MARLTLTASTNNFFDRQLVIDAAGRGRVQVLGAFGRNVRKTALASIPYATTVSRPGSPPHTHQSRKFTRTSKRTGKKRTRNVSFLREFLWFKYDPATKSVVIGPERLNSTVDPKSLPALEYGGPSTVRDHGVLKPIEVEARPFMGPAFESERPGLPALWKDSIK